MNESDAVEIHIEFADEDWNPDVSGLRPLDVVAYVDGDEVSRERCPKPGYYEAGSTPGSDTSDETQSDIEEIALRRAAATGQPVVVATFSSSGDAQVDDVATNETGELSLRPVGTVRVTPSKPPKVLRRLLGNVARPRMPRRATPRGRRARPPRNHSPPDDPDLPRCPVCELRFAWPGLLEHHLRFVHSVEVEDHR